MRILVHEFASGGGFAGRDVPASLAREGAAMRAAVVADLAALRRHEIVTTADPRFPLRAPPAVEVLAAHPERATLSDRLIASADAVWLIAPETDRCLERLAARVERNRRRLLGPGASAIRRASDKAGLARRLALHGIPHPIARLIRRDDEVAVAVAAIGYPLVVKPRRGAGCGGVGLVRNARELGDAIRAARRAGGRQSVVLQRYIRGTAASVSLLCDGRRATALSVNAQSVRASHSFVYSGGCTPIDHPLAHRAVDAARRTCRAVQGLRGYVGVDLVLTESEAFVIEVNPRLTTAYLGVRSAVGEDDGERTNIAGMVIASCDGHLQRPPCMRQRVRFTSAGHVVTLR